MEIERKFLIDEMPNSYNLKPFGRAYIEQSYLSIEPEVRIRKRTNLRPDGQISSKDFKMCVKGNGDLSRIEVEFEIEERKYEQLLSLCGGSPIIKGYQKYELSKGLIAECSIVDNLWCYAEVEFNSEEEANNFIPPKWMRKEVTYDKEFKMKNYWKNTRK